MIASLVARALPLGQSDMLTGFMPLLGIALITLALLMMLRKRKQRSAQEPTAREQLERFKQKQAMRGDLEHLMVELEQLTRRFNAQLDAKSLQLEKLIDQADRRIDELKRLQGEEPGVAEESGESASNRSGQRPDAFSDDADAEAAGRSAWPTEPSGSDRPAALPSGLAGRGSAAAPVAGGVRDEDALTGRVYALADEGHGAAEIARQLDEHIGKIELMLALRKA